MSAPYDAILVISFGGPEGPDEVIPFLENVLRGRNVPRERLLAVAEHYYHFGGVSPINGQVRDLIAALEPELARHEIDLPIYWGNRNWHPMLAATVEQMAARGVKRALGLVLSAYSSYSSCRQYREDIERARESVGNDAPQIEKIRVFYNHPEFIAAGADRLRMALAQLSEEQRSTAQVAFTAHSIPMSMADRCDYSLQLTETCRLVAEKVGIDASRWQLVYQSRSGRPSDPWLEPEICDHLKAMKEQGAESVAIMPVGFLSDHLEVLYDLDIEARKVCAELELNMVRGGTVGTHPGFVGMLRELVAERLDDSVDPRAVGKFGPRLECPANCCLPLPQVR